MTTVTLYPAGYLIRVRSSENDGDNIITNEISVTTDFEVRVFEKIFELFEHHDVGNIFEGDDREIERMREVFEEFAEDNPQIFKDVEEDDPWDTIMDLASKIGLNNSEWFTRSPDKFEVFYFEKEVTAVKII
jgi:hypothetical protein